MKLSFFPLTLALLSFSEKGIKNVSASDIAIPVYEIAKPMCTNDNLEDSVAEVKVVCVYDITIPEKLGIDSIESELLDGTNCTDVAPSGLTEKTPTLSDSKDSYSIVVDISPEAAAAGDSIKFCLRTKLMDEDGFEMGWHGQILSLSFGYTYEFTISQPVTKFEGISKETTQLGSIAFEVDVYRCKKNKERIPVTQPLQGGKPLYICFKSSADNIMVKTVDDFTITREDSKYTYKPIDDGDPDSNTNVADLGSEIVMVATRPRTTLFETDGNIIIEGSTTLEATTITSTTKSGSDRHLRHLIHISKEMNDEGVTMTNFHFEIPVVKDSSVMGLKKSSFTQTGAILGIGAVLLVFLVSKYW